MSQIPEHHELTGPDFTEDRAWVESVQNRWLAWMEARQLTTKKFREISFTDIEEAVGMSPWDGRAIMDSVAKKLRNSL